MSCFDVKKRVGQTDERGVYSSVVLMLTKELVKPLKKGIVAQLFLMLRKELVKPLEKGIVAQLF